VILEVHTAYVEPGYSISDNYYTNLTVTTGSDLNKDVVGTYTITYDTTDGSSNPAIQKTRTIEVVDTTAPLVTLVGSGELSIEVQGSFTDEGANWTDNYDGTGHFTATSGNVNVNIVGDYVLSYTKVDTNGNTGNIVTRTVHIVDTTAPVLTANPGTDTVEVKTPRTDAGADWSDNYDGTGTVYLYSGTVNTGVVGSYQVDYRKTDANGNTGYTSRTVTVEDRTKPVITINGSGTVTLAVHDTYTEL
jgi:hypothetical protein